MSTEKFTFKAGTGVAHHTEEEGLMLIGANLDESVKWVSAPKGLKDTKEGEQINVKGFSKIRCRCGNSHLALLLDKKIDSKRLVVYECKDKYLFGLM